jgi:hypothetical protein
MLIEALSCPQCGADSYRALGAHARGVRAACALCGAVYVLPSAARLQERADRYKLAERGERGWDVDELSYHRRGVVGPLEPRASGSWWARLCARWRAWGQGP